MANTHLLDVCVCIVCPGGADFGTWHFNGSWSLMAQGYMLDWLGDVASTMSSCQLLGGVHYPTNHVHKFHASYEPILDMSCVKYAFCIVFHPYILSVAYFTIFISCINLHFSPYGISILIP